MPTDFDLEQFGLVLLESSKVLAAQAQREVIQACFAAGRSVTRSGCQRDCAAARPLCAGRTAIRGG
jgi:hypothetical protein